MMILYLLLVTSNIYLNPTSDLLNHSVDQFVDLPSNSKTNLTEPTLPWRVSLIDTGLNTAAGRITRCEHLLDDVFFLTYETFVKC